MSKLPAAIGPYSVYRKAGDFVFVSGQLPINGDTNEMPKTFDAQCTQVMENIKLVLAELDASIDNIVKTTIFMQDLGDFQKLNEIYGSYFGKEFPARSAFQVCKLPKEALVEIEFIVHKG